MRRLAKSASPGRWQCVTERPCALIDTNVWVSAFINPGGPPAAVLAGFLQQQYVLIISQSLLNEIEDVLSRPRIRRRLRVSVETIVDFLESAHDYGAEIFPTSQLHLCRDPKDDILLETAILGEADYVVSRDDDMKRDLDLITHLRERGIEVVPVAEFLDLLADR